MNTLCVGECHLGPKGWCMSCGRTPNEIQNWLLVPAEGQSEIAALARRRLSSPRLYHRWWYGLKCWLGGHEYQPHPDFDSWINSSRVALWPEDFRCQHCGIVPREKSRWHRMKKSWN